MHLRSGVSFAVIPWIEKDGFTKVCKSPGSVVLLFCVANSIYLQVGGCNTLIEGLIFATTLAMYIYGDRVRQWTSKFSV